MESKHVYKSFSMFTICNTNRTKREYILFTVFVNIWQYSEGNAKIISLAYVYGYDGLLYMWSMEGTLMGFCGFWMMTLMVIFYPCVGNLMSFFDLWEVTVMGIFSLWAGIWNGRASVLPWHRALMGSFGSWVVTLMGICCPWVRKWIGFYCPWVGNLMGVCGPSVGLLKSISGP